MGRLLKSGITPSGLDIAAGRVTGTSLVHKFGRNPIINTAADEDIWSGGGTYAGFIAAAATVNVVSTSIADDGDPAGTGANTIELQGLDTNFDLQTETLTLNGTTDVLSANSYIRIFRMVIKSAGSGGVNAGTITATSTGAGTPVMAHIAIADNQTTMAIYTIPNNMNGYLTNFYAAVNKETATASVNISLLVAPENEPFQLKHIDGVLSTGTSHFNHVYVPGPIKFSPKTDIKLRGSTSANSTDVSGGFDIILEKI